jgi:uncharacterized protein YbaA (DUF1428 family)
MPQYVDGFVIPVPKKNVKAYRKIAALAGKIWIEYGAMEYRECVGDDLKVNAGQTFSKALKLKPSETVIFSWIVYRSKAQRDRINAKVMKDPRIAKMDPKTMPFDCNRMIWGGFKTLLLA